MTFVKDTDYSLIGMGDVVETDGLDALLRGDLSAVVKVVVTKPDGSRHEIETDHSLSRDQVDYIRAGSALNVIRAKAAAAAATHA